jgi:ribosomal peptide maturation radical SAM protein 1
VGDPETATRTADRSGSDSSGMSSSVLDKATIRASHAGGVSVALVCMPWGSILKPSLGVALLKSCLRSAGFHADVHFLNMRFAEQLGLSTYELIADRGHLYGEWFFSQVLFGTGGLDEIHNSWCDIKSDPGVLELVNLLELKMEDSDEFSRKIVEEQIPRFLDDCLSQIEWSEYDLVGFSTTFSQSLSSLLLARQIKERCPRTRIILGGANVNSEMGLEFLRAFPWIDYVAHGEAESSLLQLLEKLASGDADGEVAGISMRRGSKLVSGDQAKALVDLNDSPIPEYSDYLRELETRSWRRPNLRLFFESSRGCWWGEKHHCAFCGLNGEAISFRRKNSDRVYREIEQLARDYCCLHFSATDNIFPLEYVSQLLPKLAELDVDLDLFYEVKGNLSRDRLKALAAAGVRTIQPGIESFNSRLLQGMQKGITALQNVQLLKWCCEYGIEPLYNILFELPGEEPEDYKELPHWFQLLGHLRPPSSIHPVRFHRFSPYHAEQEQFGLKLVPARMYEFIFPSMRVNLERIAYYFERQSEGDRARSRDYMAPSLKAWNLWQASWKRTVCYYEKGPGYLDIYDDRREVVNGPSRCRRVHLDEQVSALYLLCDENRSVQSIVAAMTEKFPGSVAEVEVRRWLEELVSQGLMLREGDRFLSLAVRKQAT